MSASELETQINRFKVNEERLNTFVNVDGFYTTSSGVQVPTLLNVSKRIETSVENISLAEQAASIEITRQTDLVIAASTSAQQEFLNEDSKINTLAKNTITDWQTAIDTITQTEGVPALAVSTANNETQQSINDSVGAKWYAKGGGYPINYRAMLDNGDIVKSTAPNNTINPNIDMTGWIKTNAASQIFDASGTSQQTVNDKLDKEALSRLPISRFCDVTGVEPSDNGIAEALAYSALHGVMLEITGKIRITKTVIQPAGSSVDCVNGIVFCENPIGLTNSEMWVVKDDVTIFKTTRIGTLILSTGSDISSFVDRDVVGLKVTSPKITVTNLYTYGCRLGGLITDAPAYEFDVKWVDCMINSWTDKTKWGISLNAQDGTAGTLVTLGYAKGVRVGGTNHVVCLHPWGLPATSNPLEYPNKQLLTGVALATNAHVTHAYLDTIDTENFDAPQTNDEGVAIVFEGANARIDKAFVLVHGQTKVGKVKLVSYYGAQNTIAELTVGDSSRLDTTTPVKYSVPVQKWQNHVLGGNVLFLTNRFIYPADDLINGGVFNGSVEFRRVGYGEILVDANISYISGTISDSSFGISMPDGLGVASLSGEVAKRTMLKPLAGAVSKIVFNNPRISPAKFIEETGIIALYAPSDIWAGELNFTARFINASAAY